jgi:hypothetical protein
MSKSTASVSTTDGTYLSVVDPGKVDTDYQVVDDIPDRIFVTFTNQSGQPEDMARGDDTDSVDLNVEIDGGPALVLMLPPSAALELAELLKIVATGKGGQPSNP